VRINGYSDTKETRHSIPADKSTAIALTPALDSEATQPAGTIQLSGYLDTPWKQSKKLAR
jgi:hypothetical protein